MLGLIGLGIRARTVVVGVEQVRVAARKGRLSLAVVAADASPHSRGKVLPLLEARRVRVVEVPSAAALGAAAGREATAAVGILDAALARGIRAVLTPAVGAASATRTRNRGMQTSRKDESDRATESPVSRLPSPVRS
jgi:ribosomal protein L7Ae-like RNA K-turn-binding protein